jgi:hypothetical protein
LPDVGADLPDQVGVRGVPRPGPHPDRDAVPGDRHPDHHLRQVVAGVLRLAVDAEPGLLHGALAVLADALAVLVARYRVVAEPAPQLVQDVGAAGRAGRRQRQLAARRRGDRAGGVQQPGQGRDQALDALSRSSVHVQ